MNGTSASELVSDVAQVQVSVMGIDHLHTGSHVLGQLVGRDIRSGQCPCREVVSNAVQRSLRFSARVGS